MSALDYIILYNMIIVKNKNIRVISELSTLCHPLQKFARLPGKAPSTAENWDKLTSKR
jgi:hypothetical protein